MKIKISACTITKNEEKNIARSIESYKDYVDEIIIVDTGSTDNTVQIAKSLGAKVIDFKWINDFSAAKNCALNAATGDWILFLDADEWIKDNGAMKMQSVINKAISEGFDAISLRMLNLEDDGSVLEITSSLRLFVNKPYIRYIRKIHEYLFDSEKQRPLISFRPDDILLNHSGYATSITKTKLNRNKDLLEKNYLTGNAQAIDYFYLAREISTLNPERAKQFLDILINDESKIKEIRKLDIVNSIHDLKIKIMKLLKNKYSFKEKIRIIDEAINEFPDDPTYYYHKYVVLKEKNNKRIDLLVKALELDKVYEKKVNGNNNAFSMYKCEVLCELGCEALLVNDNMKAMEYFVQAIQTGEKNSKVLKGLLYIINSQKLTEKVTFLNSLYNISSEEVLEFLVQALRLTQYNDVFLYYFVKYYKDFGKVDVSLFTSMMINNSYKDAADKYFNILLNENDERAEILIVSAIIAGSLKEFYDANKTQLKPIYRKILNGYFDDSVIDDFTQKEWEIISAIVPEILHVVSDEVIERLKNTFNNDENILRIIVNNYFISQCYHKTITQINKFIENDLSDEFAGEVTAILGKCFYKLGDYSSAKLYLSQAIEIGYLDEEVATVYEKLLENANNQQEINKFNQYKDLLNKVIEVNNFINCEEIDEISHKNISGLIQDFETETSDILNLTDKFKKQFLEYANKLFEINNWFAAEEYYKVLIRCGYNLGLSYYNLGKIYNVLGFADLSYYCYKKAFETSIDFPMVILPEKHKNIWYLYKDVDESTNNICPICGEEGKLKKCYTHIESDELLEGNSLIVKYRECEKCNHIFAENYAMKEIFAEEVKDEDEYIFNVYDIEEKLDSNAEILVLSENSLLNDIMSKDFDSQYIKGSFEKTIDLSKLFEEINKYKNRVLVTVINNIESNFENEEHPLWAKSGIINAYSKQSINKLLNDKGLKNIRIYNSKFLKGKMVIIAEIV